MGTTSSSTVVGVTPDFRVFRKWTFAETTQLLHPFIHSKLRRFERLPCASLNRAAFTSFLRPPHLTHTRLCPPSRKTSHSISTDPHHNIILLQANVRRFLCLRRLDKWLLDRSTGDRRIERVFNCFGSGNGPNPYDGAKSIDAHQVVVSLLLLCEGKVQEKLHALFTLFAIESKSTSSLNVEEAVVLLIVCLNAVRIICGDSAEGIEAFDVEALAFSMRGPGDSQVISYDRFVRKVLEGEPHAKWIGLFCSDCTRATFHLCQRDWTVLVSSSTIFPSQPHANCNQDEWVAVIHGDARCDIQDPRTPTPRSFLVRVDRTGETLLSLKARFGGVSISGPVFDFGSPDIAFKLSDSLVSFSAVALNVSLRVRSEVRWCPEDEIGLFEAVSPLDARSAFTSKKLNFGSLQQRVIRLESLPDHRYTRLFQFVGNGQRYCWLDLRHASFAALNISVHSFQVGSNVLLRIDSCSCKSEVNACCRFSMATVLTVNKKSKQLSAKRCGSQAVVAGSLTDVIPLSTLADVTPLAKDLRLLCSYNGNEFRLGQQIYSGKFELRYVDASGKLRSRSRAFDIIPSPLKFRPFSGGHLDKKLNIAYDKADDIEPTNAGVILTNYLKSASQEEIVGKLDHESQIAVIDPYYYHLTAGGLFRVQLQANSEIVAESNYAVVSPIIELTPSVSKLIRNRKLRTQKLTCVLQQIPADRLWSNWDAVELVAVNQNASVAFKYVHWAEREAGKAAILLTDSIPNGQFYWLFRGKSVESRKSEVFEVYEEAARKVEGTPLIESAVVIQKAVRRFLAQGHYVALQQAAEESTRKIREDLELAVNAYEARRNANAKRNPVLLSMRDKVAEKKALKKVEALEQEIIELSGISRELTPEESVRVIALQAMANEEAIQRSLLLSEKRESKRRSDRRIALYTLKKSLLDPSSELRFSEELSDVYDWRKSRLGLHKDRDFPPTFSSLGDMFAHDQVQWRRVTESPILPPFTETIDLLQVCSRNRHMDSVYLAFHVLLQRRDRLSQLLNFDHAQQGIWQVVFSDRHVMLLDDWLPGIIDQVTGEWKPLSSESRNGSVVLMIEKPLAKMEGSYSALISAQKPAEEILARLYTGHFRSFITPAESLSPPLAFIDDPLSLSISRSSQAASNVGDVSRLVSRVQRPDLYVVFVRIDSSEFVARRVCQYHEETLVQLFNCKNYEEAEYWSWDGAWSDGSELWTEDATFEVGYDPIDDGSFWMRIQDLADVITSWGFTLISQPKLDSASCETELDFPQCEASSFVVENPDANVVHVQLEAIDLANYIETRVDIIIDGGEDVESMVLLPSISSQTLSTSAKQFEIRVKPWLSGVQYKARLRLLGASWHAKEEAFPGKRVDLPRDVCVGCYTPISGTTWTLRGLQWHPSCFGCAECLSSIGKPFTQPSFPINAMVYCYETCKMRAVCASCWRTCKYSPKCSTCGDHQDIDGTCPTCDLQKRMKEAEKCKQCHGPLLAVNEWSGSIVAVKEGNIHKECEYDFKAASTRKCVLCKGPLLKSARFSGRIRRTRRGIMHAECADGTVDRVE